MSHNDWSLLVWFTSRDSPSYGLIDLFIIIVITPRNATIYFFKLIYGISSHSLVHSSGVNVHCWSYFLRRRLQGSSSCHRQNRFLQLEREGISLSRYKSFLANLYALRVLHPGRLFFSWVFNGKILIINWFFYNYNLYWLTIKIQDFN